MDKLFGQDGISGKAFTKISCELIMQTGRALVTVLSRKIQHRLTIFIGKDTRLSSDIFENALAAGICSSGADVKFLGVVPSSAVAYLVKKCGAAAGVMITASQSGFEYNGLKIFTSAGYKISDDVEDEISNLVLKHPENIIQASQDMAGVMSVYKNAEWDYLRHLIKLDKFDFTGMRAVIDCANGSVSECAEKLYSALGLRCFVVNSSPDGKNINKNCGVVYSGLLQKNVSEKRADLALVFDGDGSRCVAVDEEGNTVDGDQIMSFIAIQYKKEGKLKKDTVVVTGMSNFGFSHFAKINGINLHTSKPGEKNIIEKLLDGGYSIGGEISGKIIFSENSTVSDGLLIGLQILQTMSKTKKKLSELASYMKKYPLHMIEVNILPQYKELWKNIPDITNLIEEKQYGLGDDGRILVREIGSEPLIRIIVEGKSSEVNKQYAEEISNKIREQTNAVSASENK